MLSALEVRNAKPKDKPYKLTDAKGLYLYIAPSGTKTWRYRYTIAGKESVYVIGEYPALSLEAARKERAEMREKVKAGTNLAEERRQLKQAAISRPKKKRRSWRPTALKRWRTNGTTTGKRDGPPGMQNRTWPN